MDPTASYGVGMTTNTKGGVMKIKSSRRLVARLGLALAVAAIAVPGAQAMTMNAMNESGGGYSVRQYADDLHASFVVATLPPSNVRTDAASLQPSSPGSNVLTDSASFPGQPVSLPGANVRTDAASSQPVSTLISDVQTDGASSVPLTDARHSALLAHRARLGLEPTQVASIQPPASDSPGIDWSVAAVGAVLGMLGLTLLFGIVFYAGRHHRSRLAAT
jgi:hypothetical protein